MSVQAIVWVLENSKSRGATRCVLLAIANHIDAADGDGWTYIEQILSEANCSDDTYRRAIDWLYSAGELKVAVRQGGSRHVRDAYRPNHYRMQGYRDTLDTEKLERAERGKDRNRPLQFAGDSQPGQTPADCEGPTPAGCPGPTSADCEGPTPATCRGPYKEPSKEPSKEPYQSDGARRDEASASRTGPEAEARHTSTTTAGARYQSEGAEILRLVVKHIEAGAIRAKRPDPGLARLWNLGDVGAVVVLERTLGALVANGWAQYDLVDAIADSHDDIGSAWSIAAVLLTRARALPSTPPDITSARSYTDELLERRVTSARRQGEVMAAAGCSPDEIRDRILAEFGDELPDVAIAAIDAGFAGADLDPLGRPNPPTTEAAS